MTDDDIVQRRREFLALLSAGAMAGMAGCGSGQSGSSPTATERMTPPPSTPTETATPAGDQQEQSFETQTDLMVEMRDGVKLATNVYIPQEGEGPYPTLVNRTPYNKDEQGIVGGTDAATSAGYAVVQQDVRGRYASEGDWQPFFNEGPDGHDTIEWAADQEWSTGDVGIYGLSYMGITTWQAVIEEPPSLKAAAPFITPTDYYHHSQFNGGVGEFGLGLFFNAFTTFNDLQNALEGTDVSAQKARRELGALLQNFQEVAKYLPTEEMPAFDEGVAPHWEAGWEHLTDSDYWAELDVLNQIEGIPTPVIHAGGWYDIFTTGHTELFSAIEQKGTDTVRDNQHMVMGPYKHLTFGTSRPVGERQFPDNAAIDLAGDLIVPWFDRWLKGEGEGVQQASVRYYQMGDDEWRTAETWPPRSASPEEFYLSSGGNANSRDGDGTLSRERPAADAPVDTYEYDPLDPVPTRGGPLLMGSSEPGGVFDQRPTEDRDDVLVYTSGALSEPVRMAGEAEASLFVRSTAPDTDFVVRLVDVAPDGYAANITEAALRTRYRNSFEDPEFMEPGELYELPLDFRPTAHTFQAGHRIRVDVTSSNFPRYDRNPNAAMPVPEAAEADMATATQTVLHDAVHPSRVVLPTMDAN